MNFGDAFTWSYLDYVVAIAGFAFIGGAALTGLMQSRTAWDRGVEALAVGGETALLAVIGATIARAFVTLLLSHLPNTAGMHELIALGFFFLYGAIAFFPFLAHNTSMIDPNTLLSVATIVGTVAGIFDGFYWIHDWKGSGFLSFPLDLTWGLSGTMDACLMHLINIYWGDHSNEYRHSAHRYASGFCLRPNYAFTQGSAMSGLTDAFGTNLYYHERTHVWQNRIAGPAYTSFYVFWMLVMLVPALIVGLAKHAGVRGTQVWCYFNNPWETYAYHVQQQSRAALLSTTAEKDMVWPGLAIGVVAGILAVAYFALSAVAVRASWGT